VLRIGAMDYEPTKLVQKVMIQTKMTKTAAMSETKEEREANDNQRSRWLTDIDCVNRLLKLIDNKNNEHKTCNKREN